ncbi:S1C family serine protease [Paraburkholderia sp. SIMBA_049]
MPPEQVKALFLEAQKGMTEHVAPSLVEVYYPSAVNPEFMENGTGSFVHVDGTNILVTNDHVIENKGLHHSFFGFNGFVHAAEKRYGLAAPIDVGAARVPEILWAQHGTEASSIPFHRFAVRHQTVPHEILWTAGYPGARVKQLAQLTLSVCQALPTQEYLFHDDDVPHEAFDPHYHFAVGYSPEEAQPFDISRPSSGPGLSDPHGLSGSLVWNTRRLECFYIKQPWDASLAVVTGIVWAWPKSNYLIATKVEHIRQFLLDASKLPSSAR